MILAVDVGFGRTKGVSKNQKIDFPSVVDNFRDIAFSGLGGTDRINRLAVNYLGEKYFVGKLAKKQGNPRATMNADRFTEPEGMVLLLTALALLSEQGHKDIKLVVGLPVHDYARLKNKYRNHLKGVHEIKDIGLSGKAVRDYVFSLKDVRIMPQPFGTLLSKIFTTNGEAIDLSYQKDTVGIVDIGYHTVDLALISEMEYIDRQCVSINDTGIYSIYSDISDEIYINYGKQILPERLEDSVLNGHIGIRGELQPISDIIQKACSNRADFIIPQIKNRWDLDSIDRIIITGGGASFIGNMLASKIDHKRVEISDHGMYTNVLGYFGYGAMTFYKKKIY